MKVYEIFEINSIHNERCAIALDYQTAIDYVLANTDNKIEGVKVNGEWCYDYNEHSIRQPCDEIKIFGKCNGGYYFNGFLIKAVETI